MPNAVAATALTTTATTEEKKKKQILSHPTRHEKENKKAGEERNIEDYLPKNRRKSIVSSHLISRVSFQIINLMYT